jgi:UDPglucose--hexose-1-phosphate uridylyltransferase
MSEQRLNELRGEEVVYAIHRQGRTFLPPKDHCPLCPTPARPHAPAQPHTTANPYTPADPHPPSNPQSEDFVETEIPLPAFEIAVFDNLYPTFRAPQGAAEVIVYTDSHHGSLGTLAPERAEALMWVWRHRYQELGARDDVQYVLIFENRGIEVGATLEHPHGQIYGYPFLPPVPKLELAADARLQGCASCELLRRELEDGRRVVHENESVAAYIPYAARWPYETHAVIRRHRPSLLECEPDELRQLSECLQILTRGYDALFSKPFPYVMVVHQAPTDGHSDGHLHVEFYPPLRTATKLKYPAGSEQGGGTFVGDTLPEECAAELREAIVSVA